MREGHGKVTADVQTLCELIREKSNVIIFVVFYVDTTIIKFKSFN